MNGVPITLPPPLGAADVRAAAARIGPHARPVTLIAADAGPFEGSAVYLADEATQFTGTFKIRGALNFAGYHLEHDTVPAAGITAAAHGAAAAAIACAWAARRRGVPVTIHTAPDCRPVALERLRRLDAVLRPADGPLGADEAAADHARATGALLYHTYDNPLAAAGSGTIALEVMDRIGDEIDTVLLPVGTGTLLAGTCAALEHSGVKVVPAEPAARPALSTALTAARPVYAPAARESDLRDSGAQDIGVRDTAIREFGARENGNGTRAAVPDRFAAPRVSALALALAAAHGVEPVLVPGDAIDEARATLWADRRLAADRDAATALAALRCGAYKPERYERVVILLTGADPDPAILVPTPRHTCGAEDDGH